uniref:tRNA:m(4)X modification enzyme TRM13 n=1 Tax=Buteo japonicus TaxID=224669 RepID=A0A8C0B406_9AVES
MAAAEQGRGSPVPGRCAYFVERKKRFCKMTPAPGRRFCGEHGQQEVPGLAGRSSRLPSLAGEDGTVYEDQLQKHLKKCNSREKPKPVYFVQDINAGLKDVAEIPEKQVSTFICSKAQSLHNMLQFVI